MRGEAKALHFLTQLNKSSDYELWIGAMQRAEIVFFMRPDEEELTMMFLSQFKTQSVDQSTIDDAGLLYRTWNPSHGVDVNDAILAAIVRKTGGVIFCQNKKHYPMRDIVVKKAWQRLLIVLLEPSVAPGATLGWVLIFPPYMAYLP